MSSEERKMVDWADDGLIRSDELRICRDTVDAMDQTMIDNINRVVGKEDILWHIGDFCFSKGNSAYSTAKSYLDRIKCRNVKLVWGNHDRRVIGQLFQNTYEQMLVNVHNQHLFLNHYPMRTWDRSHHGSWQLYGHVHGLFWDEDLAGSRLTMDVGVDKHNFYPWSFDEIKDHMAKIIPQWEARQLEIKNKIPSSAKKG